MSRIPSIFAKKGHKALIAYITVGYPSIQATLDIVPLLAKNGCDLIELGIPFSDPLADGVTIQNASYQALRQGVTPTTCLKVASELKKKVDVPLVFMSYYNPIFVYGLDEFCSACLKNGIDGLIIPDLPPEEGGLLEACTQTHQIDLIYLLAPTSTDERINLVAEKSRGFIYLVSVTGVTGARTSLPQDLSLFVQRVRKTTSQPLCVGFGISEPEQAKQVSHLADGVIIGSKIIKLMEANDNYYSLVNFVKTVRKSVDE